MATAHLYMLLDGRGEGECLVVVVRGGWLMRMRTSVDGLIYPKIRRLSGLDLGSLTMPCHCRGARCLCIERCTSSCGVEMYAAFAGETVREIRVMR